MPATPSVVFSSGLAGAAASGQEDPSASSLAIAHRWSIDWTPTVAAASGRTRYFTAVVVTGSGRGRQGPPSAVIAVPLDPLPVAPTTSCCRTTQTSIRVVWTPGPEASLFEVTRSGSASESPGSEAINACAHHHATRSRFRSARSAVRVVFACAQVRVTGPVTVEGPFTAPQCITPADTYPPPAPSRPAARCRRTPSSR